MLTGSGARSARTRAACGTAEAYPETGSLGAARRNLIDRWRAGFESEGPEMVSLLAGEGEEHDPLIAGVHCDVLGAAAPPGPRGALPRSVSVMPPVPLMCVSDESGFL